MDEVSPEDIEAAALQYVRKVVGMRRPSTQNQAAFDAAVEAVSLATQTLLHDVTIRPGGAPRSGTLPAPPRAAHAAEHPSQRPEPGDPGVSRSSGPQRR